MSPAIFQSTRLSRASTWLYNCINGLPSDFNPQGSREPRHTSTTTPVIYSLISIHKALASLDRSLLSPLTSAALFQSTRLSRASTCYPVHLQQESMNFNPQGSREPRRASWISPELAFYISIHKALASLDCFVTTLTTSVFNFNPQGSREPRQQNYPNLLHIPPNILCIMLFSPQFNQFSPFTQPAFTAFSSVFQVRISQAFHVSLAFAPGLKGSQLTETNSTYILHNPSFPAYILHAAKPLPPPTDTLSIQASFVPDIWLPA